MNFGAVSFNKLYKKEALLKIANICTKVFNCAKFTFYFYHFIIKMIFPNLTLVYKMFNNKSEG